MTIKERLAKVDKRVWVGLSCALLGMLIMSFFIFNGIGKLIVLYWGYVVLGLLLLLGISELYYFILNKIGLVKENPISIKFSCHVNKPEANKKESEPDESANPEEVSVEEEVIIEDEEI